MKRTMTILLLTALVSSGCATVRKTAIDLSTENVKNAETIKTVSTNCLSVWPIQSGFIKGALGGRINELPTEVTDAIVELDRLAELPEQSDYELGLFLGLKVRLLGSVSQKAIEKYAPNIIEYMQLAF